ncbi:MAG: TlpA disulfide reductase family protein [Bacteroidota bacterium]
MTVFIKKHFFTAVWIILLGIVLFIPDAKAFLLKTFLYTGIFNASAKKEAIVIKAGTFTNFSFAGQNGSTLSLSDLKGKCVFINFWATWCPPCMAEMGAVNALYNKLKNDSRFVFIIADADNNFPLALSFMKKNNYNLPVYGIASPVPQNIFTGTLPTTLIIDVDGNIVQKHEGIANYNTGAMLEFLKGLAGH